jgi:hypothetical protein
MTQKATRRLYAVLLFVIASSLAVFAQNAKIHVRVDSEKCDDSVGIVFSHEIREALRHSPGFTLDATGNVVLYVVCADPFTSVAPGQSTVASIAVTRITTCGRLFLFQLVAAVPKDRAAEQAASVLASLSIYGLNIKLKKETTTK